jgi:tellurite resistance protein TerC
MLAAASDRFVDLDVPMWAWLAVIAFILVLLLFDLVVVHRHAHVATTREAAIESAVWISIGLAFSFVILWGFGGAATGEYISGYLIEESLSIDNVFVWALILGYFTVPAKYQHRVLFWGVLGALVFRGVMIGAGAALLHRFEWIIYVFGAFLVFTGIRMATQKDVEFEPESNPALKLVRRFLPVTGDYEGKHFFTRETVEGRVRRVATPLFVVLVLVETTDLIFAVDSIPAIFAVTRNPFLVFTSNVFAILCLRSLYFMLAGVIDRFHYLKLGLSVVLVFIGAKMLATMFHVHVDTLVSLLVVAGVLLASVAFSLLRPLPDSEPDPTEAGVPHDVPAPPPDAPVAPPDVAATSGKH